MDNLFLLFPFKTSSSMNTRDPRKSFLRSNCGKHTSCVTCTKRGLRNLLSDRLRDHTLIDPRVLSDIDKPNSGGSTFYPTKTDDKLKVELKKFDSASVAV